MQTGRDCPARRHRPRNGARIRAWLATDHQRAGSRSRSNHHDCHNANPAVWRSRRPWLRPRAISRPAPAAGNQSRIRAPVAAGSTDHDRSAARPPVHGGGLHATYRGRTWGKDRVIPSTYGRLHALRGGRVELSGSNQQLVVDAVGERAPAPRPVSRASAYLPLDLAPPCRGGTARSTMGCPPGQGTLGWAEPVGIGDAVGADLPGAHRHTLCRHALHSSRNFGREGPRRQSAGGGTGAERRQTTAAIRCTALAQR